MAKKQPFVERDYSARCSYGAPFFAFQREGKRYGIVQGNCNHWDCPRCGWEVAAQHYGRIVEGARKLENDGVKLSFLTVTCRGLELSADDAFKHYLEWTNRLIDAMRAKHTRKTKSNPEPSLWAYVQVTEKQKRSHPHSHFLTSFMPNDTVLGIVDKWKRERGVMVKTAVEALRSDWLQSEVIAAGLGEQYDISEVETAEAASRYVAKYMFKKSQFTSQFPKGWKRVRYSHTWPTLPAKESNAFIVMTLDDWAGLSVLAAVVDAYGYAAQRMARLYLATSGVIVNEVEETPKNKNSQAT